jgi:multidrug transporter EmrE-like cation transporter
VDARAGADRRRRGHSGRFAWDQRRLAVPGAARDISLGTSYAVWTGIGAAGTFLVGVWFFGDPSSFGRWLGAALIIAGVITLKLAH